MKFEREEISGINVVRFEGNMLHEASHPEIIEEVENCLAEGRPNFIFDFGQIRHINSTGLGLLINLLGKSRKAGGEIILCDISEMLKKLLVMTKLNNVFLVKDTYDEALERLKDLKNI